MRKIAANRRTNKEYNEYTKDINKPNIPRQILDTRIINQVETFQQVEMVIHYRMKGYY
jgi:hypothetical protein